VGLVLGRRQQELAESEEPRVEVKWPGFGVAPGRRQVLLQGIRAVLDRRQTVGGNQVLEGEEVFAQPGAHRRLVIAGLVEVVEEAHERRRPELTFQLPPGPGERLGVAAKARHDQ
jgi:hypothetical protein